MAGKIKYSKEKLILVAIGNIRIGYSISENSTINNPNKNVKAC
jgi:hypothetical protein